MRKNRKWVIIFAIGALLLVSWFVQLYFVGDHAGAIVFQRGDEAYLFLGGGHTGWHFPALAYPVILAMNFLGAVNEPSDQVRLSLVMRVTPAGVQRWMNQATDVSDITPFE